MGAIAGGCNFVSSYPMSPSTPVLTFLAQHGDDFGDDGRAGRGRDRRDQHGDRGLVRRSPGPGDHLRRRFRPDDRGAEPVRDAGDARGDPPGPAARTGDGPAHAHGARAICNWPSTPGHGEFPRIILAPGTLEDGFYLTQQGVQPRGQVPGPGVHPHGPVLHRLVLRHRPRSTCRRLPSRSTSSRPRQDYRRYVITQDGVSASRRARAMARGSSWSTATSTMKKGTSPRTSTCACGWWTSGWPRASP